MPYGSMQMPIGWNGLAIPAEGSSVCAHCHYENNNESLDFTCKLLHVLHKHA